MKFGYLYLLFFLLGFSTAYMVGDIKSISLQRKKCNNGNCPEYTVTFIRNYDKNVYNATYVGAENAPRSGNFQARISLKTFNDLAQLLLDDQFFDLNSTYGSIDDINFPDVFIEALASSDSETTDKTVRDHHSLYQPLVDIEDTIDAITDTLQWEKAGKNTLVAIIAICLAFGVIVLFVIVSGIIYHRRRYSRHRETDHNDVKYSKFKNNFDDAQELETK